MNPGIHTVFHPPLGAAKLGVNLSAFYYPNPVRQAKALQHRAIAHGTYHAYHLISIVASTFHGNAAATWTFWWKPVNALNRTGVTEIIFTAHTSAGPQPFVLSMSAPAPRATWAAKVMHVAMRTFRALP